MDQHPVDLFGPTIDTLSRSLDLRARKHGLILNNVANADTPGYQPFTLRIEEALARQRRSGAESTLKRTDRQHLPGQAGIDDPQPLRRHSGHNPLLLRGDGNGVDIDAEMTDLAKNSLLYKASAQMVAAKFNGLKQAITGGNR